MTTIRAVLFDLDGVLVDAREWHYEALNRALRLFGYEINRVEHLSTFDGLPTRRKLEYLSQVKGFPRALHGVVNRLKQQYTHETIAVECRPVFHIEYALARLRRDGYKLAVCTNSIRRSLEQMITCSALAGGFEIMLSNEDCTRPKPAPDIYLQAMAALGVAPNEALIVEDNQHGIEAATASGAHVLRVTEPADVTYAALADAIRRLEDAPPLEDA